MTQRCGLDTSILVRLATGEPNLDFDKTVAELTRMVESEHIPLFASNMVIGEAYIVLQHHYRDEIANGLEVFNLCIPHVHHRQHRRLDAAG